MRHTTDSGDLILLAEFVIDLDSIVACLVALGVLGRFLQSLRRLLGNAASFHGV